MDLQWKTSSFSAAQSCVETAELPDGGMAVRHSKDPNGAVVRYTAPEWDAFIKGARNGEFDLPSKRRSHPRS